MEKLLSVVVPAYNVESYLKQCLDSFIHKEILEQIEVLVVDDGSTDETGAMARYYSERYPNTFRYIKKDNGGHGSAVNTGILNATGKYFKVVDGDDWVDTDNFVELVTILQNCNSDLIVSEYQWHEEKSGKRSWEVKSPFKDIQYKKEYPFQEISTKTFIKMHAMTIKTKILQENHILLDEHCFYVDMEYILYPIPYVKTVFFLDKVVYLYRIGTVNQSMAIQNMQKNSEQHRFVIKQLLMRYERLRQQNTDTEICSYFAKGIAIMIGSQMKILLSYPSCKEKFYELKEYNNMIRDNYPEVYKSNRNRAVSLLRMSHYLLYPVASWCYRWKGKV